MHHQAHQRTGLSKVFLIAAVSVMAMILGYLVVYWWVFGNFDEALNVSALKNQIVSRQRADEVKNQLEGLGYSFTDDQFFSLNSTTTKSYHADVLGGYEPVPLEEEPKEENYYFYDETGAAYFFTVDENNQVDPESFVPLISE